MNDRLLLIINGWAGKNDLLDNFMIFSAKYLIYIVIVIVLGLLVWLTYKKDWQAVVYFFLALVVSFIVLQLVGLILVDHRPFMDHTLTQLVSHAPGKSFPSDHTTIASAMAFGLLFFTRFKKTGVVVLAVAVLIGFSRIFVGVHYPADIAGGIITALLGVVLVIICKMIIHMRRFAVDQKL